MLLVRSDQKDEISGVCVLLMGEINKNLSESIKEREHLRDLVIDGRTLLEDLTYTGWDDMDWTGTNGGLL
jgi:hypothetical protein